MEDQANHTLQGPHWHPRLAEVSAEFTPLHLVIEGTETTLLVDRPEMIAGRHSEADIQLPLPDVSRRHCRFLWTAGRWQVFDLGSLNGLWINDRCVAEAFLEEGDRLQIGGFTFLVQLTGAVVPEKQRSLVSLLRALPRPVEQVPQRLAS
jgi:pSer/pThr/pTyr-binding forkhead associated (FHA) protein